MLRLRAGARRCEPVYMTEPLIKSEEMEYDTSESVCDGVAL